MKCIKCGTESTGRRTCPKCGMPLIDYGVRPKEEQEDTKVELENRNRELRPIAEAEAERKKAEREKRRKEKEEKLKALYGKKEEEEEIIVSGEDDEEEVLVSGDSGTSVELLSISKMIQDFYLYENEEVKVEGEVSFSEVKNGMIRVNLDDEEESITCCNRLLDQVEYDGMLFEAQEISEIIGALKSGDKVTVMGIFMYDGRSNPYIRLKEIEGEDFYLRCEG